MRLIILCIVYISVFIPCLRGENVIYFNDEGLCLYDLNTESIKRICFNDLEKPVEFGYQQIFINENNIIYGVLQKLSIEIKPNCITKYKYYSYNIESGINDEIAEISYQSYIMGVSLEIEKKQNCEISDCFDCFPERIEGTGALGKDFMHNGKILSLFDNIDCKAVFASDKVIFMWRPSPFFIDAVKDYENKDLTMSYGGGGYTYAYLFSKDSALYSEVPPYNFWRLLFRWGDFPVMIKELDIESGDVRDIVSLDSKNCVILSPRISKNKRYLAYGKMRKGETLQSSLQCVYDLYENTEIAVGIGHSIRFLEDK